MTDAKCKLAALEKRETKLVVEQEKKEQKDGRAGLHTIRPDRRLSTASSARFHACGGYLISGGRHKGAAKPRLVTRPGRKTPNTRAAAAGRA